MTFRVWNSTSVKTRFLVSVGANIFRSILSFATGLLVARGLNPSGYGDFMFLLGSFSAIRQLMDMGSSSAFYTFLSQKPKGTRFYLLYCVWLIVQFLIIVLFVTLLLPDSAVEHIWLGHSRSTVLLAFIASFIQQQVWNTISQIGEASRQTVRVQTLNIAIAVFHLILLLVLLGNGWVSVKIILAVMMIEYLLAVALACRVLRMGLRLFSSENLETPSIRNMLKAYVNYCSPMILTSCLAFCYEFGDRWMLQHFGGSEQQGFYQIGYQFAAISLIATVSILNIFWKEIAEAEAHRNKERVRMLYQKVSRGLLMMGAIFSGLLMPWSREILVLFLGKAYAFAWPALTIMFLYPIHQSMGQIGGTMFLAIGKTRIYMIYSSGFMLISLLVSYMAQASSSALIPGLGLGAIGMALKMVCVNMVGVNVMAWLISRIYGWKYDWLYQVIGVASVVTLGFLAHHVVGWFSDLNKEGLFLLIPIAFSGLLYVVMVAGLVWLMPWLVGLERSEIKRFLRIQNV